MIKQHLFLLLYSETWFEWKQDSYLKIDENDFHFLLQLSDFTFFYSGSSSLITELKENIRPFWKTRNHLIVLPHHNAHFVSYSL